MSEVKIAQTDAEIEACYPVIAQLRTHLPREDFLPRVKRQQERFGYQLAYLEDGGEVVAVAGFRESESLAWGSFMYVDDFVTDETRRSKGYGKILIQWLVKYGKDKDLEQFHFDSGVQREDAHRFYEREGMRVSSYHFMRQLNW